MEENVKNEDDPNFIQDMLYIAIGTGQLELCKYLINGKNSQFFHGCSHLHFTASQGHLEIYKFIANYLDDLNPGDLLGNTYCCFIWSSGYM